MSEIVMYFYGLFMGLLIMSQIKNKRIEEYRKILDDNFELINDYKKILAEYHDRFTNDIDVYLNQELTKLLIKEKYH